MKFPNLTICIPTFERPDCLRRLLESIRKFYPEERIIVVDSGKERPARDVATEFSVARYEVLPFYCGVSAARNALVRLADTELIFMCDDDMEFTEKTDLHRLPLLMREARCDLLSVGIMNDGKYLGTYWGRLDKTEDGALLRIAQPYERIGRVAIFDVVNNIFLAVRSKIASILWDERLKTSELLEFFWRAKGKIRCGQTVVVTINHLREKEDPYYASFRSKAEYYAKEADNIMGITRRNRCERKHRRPTKHH